MILFAKSWWLLKSTHPIPSFAVTGFTVLLAIGYGIPTVTVLLIGISVLTQQFSVGLSNDWLDSTRDRTVGRKDKPAATGEVSARLIRNSSLVCAILALASASILGWSTALMMFAMLAIGWSYNLGLKSNGLSALPYALGFGVLPVFVTLTLEPSSIPAWWVILSASLLGISAHFANALPDLLDDEKTQVRALPHILGQRVSAFVIASAAATASLLVVTQSKTLDLVLAWGGFGLTVAFAITASALALRAKPPRVIFYLLIGATFVNVVLLMLGQSLEPA